MHYFKKLPGYLADCATLIVDSVFKMFLTLLLVRAFIRNRQSSFG